MSTYRDTVNFLLHDWLHVESLTSRERFADHSRETFGSVLDTCEKIAREKYAPFNRIADTDEPWFDGERVHLPASTHAAARAYAQSGMLAGLAWSRRAMRPAARRTKRGFSSRLR